MLSRYQNIWNGNFSFITLNYWIGYLLLKNIENVVFLCGTNNLHQYAPEDTVDDIIEIWWTFNVNACICEISPRDYNCTIHRVQIKDVDEMLKSKCVRFLFGYIGQDSGQWFTNSKTFSDKIHLIEKVISKLFISIPKNIEVFYYAGNINYYQSTKKWLFLLWLGNHDVPPLPVSYIQLPSVLYIPFV